jgi:PAS domain S-box-containing protein
MARFTSTCISTIIIASIILLGLVAPPVICAKNFKVAMFYPRDDPFWMKAVLFTKEAAADLGIDLQAFKADDDPDRMLDQVKEAARTRIDGIIFLAYQNTGEKILQIAENHKIPAILINSQLPEKDLLPRTKYEYWISSVLPDDVKAGTLLIQQLIYEARSRGIERFDVLAIEGNPKDESSIDRVRGLKSYLKHLKGLDAFKIVTGNWNRQTAYDQFKAYFNSHSTVNLVWCANDNMAMGVVQAIRGLDIQRKIVIGGIDWDKDAIEAIQQDRMQVSVGGHFLDGTWAVVLLFDYLNGVDFANEQLQFGSAMIAMTRANAQSLAPFTSQGVRSLDFRQFSKAQNSSLKLYQFDLNEIAARLAPRQRIIELTDDEKSWLAAHKNIRLGVNPERPPFEYFDAAKIYAGIASDYVRRLNQQLKVNMQPVDGLTRLQVMTAAKAGQIDVLPCAVKTPELSQFFLFTNPYLSLPMVILTRDDVPFGNIIKDFENYKVALLRDDASRDLLQGNYPNRNFYMAEDVEEALRALSRKSIDAYVGDLASITYTTQKLGLSSLKIATTTPYTYELGFAVRKDWPDLVNILNISLGAIPDSEKTDIQHRWTHVRFERRVEWAPVFKVMIPILILGLLILFMFVRWNRKLTREVNERKKAEEQLRDMEERSRLLLESAGEGIIGAGLDGKIIFVNPAAGQALGYSADEFVGRNLHRLIHHSHADGSPYPQENCPMTQSVSLGTISHVDDEVLWCKNGTAFPAEYTSVPIRRNGSIAGAVVVFRDISERKEAEEALRKSRATARGLLDATQESLLLLDKEGLIMAVNQTAARRLQKRPEELIGVNLFDLMPQDLRESRKFHFSSVLQTGNPADFEDVRDGIVFHQIYYPVQDKAGAMIGVAVFAQDITERKHMEEELKQNVAELEQFSKLAVGREMKMIRLKEEINELLVQLGQGDKYKIV